MAKLKRISVEGSLYDVYDERTWLDLQDYKSQVVKELIADLDFEDGLVPSTYFAQFNGATLSNPSNYLNVFSTNTSHGVTCRGIGTGPWVVQFDLTIDANMTGLTVKQAWGSGYPSQHELRGSGTYTIAVDSGTSFLMYPAGLTGDCNWQIDNWKVWPKALVPSHEMMTALSEKLDTKTDLTGGETNAVIIGVNAQGATQSVAIGQDTNCNNSSSVVIGIGANGALGVYSAFGVVTGGSEMVSLGPYAAAGGWRCTVVGAKASALGQSSTAIGCGAEATSSHAVTIGRGGQSAGVKGGGLTFAVGLNRPHFGNGWGHQFRAPLSGISQGGSNPSTTPIQLHGIDAYDARPQPWDIATTYSAREEVIYNKKIYLCKVTNTGQTPPAESDTYWHNISSVIRGTVPNEYWPENHINGSMGASVATWSSGGNHSIGIIYLHNAVYYTMTSPQVDNTVSPDLAPEYWHPLSNTVTDGRMYFKTYKWIDSANQGPYALNEAVYAYSKMYISLTANNTEEITPYMDSTANWKQASWSNSWTLSAIDGAFWPAGSFNVKGGDLELEGGRGTGTAKGGLISFKTHDENLSQTDGNTQGTYKYRMQIRENGRVVIGNDAHLITDLATFHVVGTGLFTGALTVGNGTTGTLIVGDGDITKTAGSSWKFGSIDPSGDENRVLGSSGARWASARISDKFDGQFGQIWQNSRDDGTYPSYLGIGNVNPIYPLDISVETRFVDNVIVPTINGVKTTAEEDTPTTVLTLDNPMGRYSNMASANSTTLYTIGANPVLGGTCTVLINAASEPSITGGTKIPGATFAANTDMYLCVNYMGATRGVEYFFIALS